MPVLGRRTHSLSMRSRPADRAGGGRRPVGRAGRLLVSDARGSCWHQCADLLLAARSSCESSGASPMSNPEKHREERRREGTAKAPKEANKT